MKKLLLLLLLFFAPINALIVESDDIRSILNHVYDTHHHKEILVVLDIDNTIAHVKDGFGGDEWFSAMLNNHVAKGIDFKTAVAEILPLYTKIQNTIWLDPVQQETVRLIRFLQDIGIAVMAITARSFPLLNRTIEQLQHLDIDLSRSALSRETIDFNLYDVAQYRHGILFGGQNNKGELLIKFFETINYHPNKVIFIDDKLKYVEQVDESMQAVHIPYVGIRYSHLDEKVKNYCLADHEDQLQRFYQENIINN
jgi:Protein of unknown function (DUF2608)